MGDLWSKDFNQIKFKAEFGPCENCEFECVSNSHLKILVKQVHTKIKDVKCSYVCSSNSNLQIHKK